MQLITEVVEVGGTRPLVQIYSDESESALAVSSVETDILARHKAHIGIERRRRNWHWRRLS